MFKSLILLGFLAGLVGPAMAATNYTGIRCEDPEVIQFIREILPKMKMEDGTNFSRILGNNTKLTATTIGSNATGFTCKVAIALNYAGNSRTIRGRFIFKEPPGGRPSAKWIAGY
jgi:hypothetical protein